MPLCEVVMRLLISLEMIKCAIRDLTSLQLSTLVAAGC